MTLNVSSIGENPQQPGINAETFIPDQLIAGNLKLVTQQARIASGNLKRGSILGQKSTDSVTTAAGAGNTGNGTLGSISIGASPKYGVFTLTASSATTFTVTDPEGNAQANATVGTAYTSDTVNFTLTAGGTAFVAGDSFTLEVVEATGDYILSVKSANDGSQNPSAVLVTDTDASSAAQTAGVYVMGEFNQAAITFDGSWSLDGIRAELRKVAIFLKSSVSAADPT